MENINWHRLFGLSLIDFFTNSNFEVELEKELSAKKQYLDIVILRKTTGRPLPKSEMPVGLESLKEHNLITYKSLHEPLESWTIDELIGHYVNYRKLASQSQSTLGRVINYGG